MSTRICLECGNKMSFYAKRCMSCHKIKAVGIRAPNYKNGQCIDNKCIDCGKKVRPQSTRCRKCADIKHSKFMIGTKPTNVGYGKNNPNYIFIDKTDLFNLYIVEKLNMQQIADKLYCNKITISKRLKQYNIPIRNASECKQGKLSACWNTNISSEERITGRLYFEYVQWRELVYKRDNYTCVRCSSRNGLGKSIHLNAHHIIPYSKSKDLRTVVSNGITLYEGCHKNFHKLFKCDGTLKQLFDFIKEEQNVNNC